MTIVVLLFLAGIWGIVLYGWFRDRLADARPADSIGSFRRQLSVLERTGPYAAPVRTRVEPARLPTIARPTVSPAVPAARFGAPAVRVRRTSPAAKRRRDILFGLLAVMVGSLLLSFVPGLGALFALHVLGDLLCIAYIGLLIHQRNVRAEREMKLRFLPATGGPDPALLLRRTGN